jgi:uncharacterized protein YjbJ (UPF0337 family)
MSEETFRWVITVAVILAAASAILQAIVVLGVVAEVKKFQVRIQALIDRAEPILDSSRKIVDETGPKISLITTDAVDIAKITREQSERIGELIKDFSERAKIQVARIDGTVDHTIGQVQAATDTVKDAVLRPVREVDGLLSGIRTAVSVYARGRRESVDHATQDEEMFI